MSDENSEDEELYKVMMAAAVVAVTARDHARRHVTSLPCEYFYRLEEPIMKNTL